MSDRRVHTRGRKCGTLARAIACEGLEGRFLLSGVAWTGAGDGVNWTDPKNWSSNPALPGPADDVTILTSTEVIHLASGSQSIHSLVSTKPLSLDDGSLVVATTATSAAPVTLNGGTLKGGNWTFTVTTSMVATPADSTLDGVTINGTLDLSTQNGTQVTVLDGLAVNGSILIGNSSNTTYGRLLFGTVTSEAGALTGHATVVFGRSGGNAIINESNQTGSAGTLTLLPDTIHGVNGTISAAFPNGTLLNRSDIEADNGGANAGAFGGTLNVSAGSVINDGTLGANGGTLMVSGLTGNAGYVQLPSATRASTLTLDGHYVIDQPVLVTGQSTLNLKGNWSGTSTITVSGGRLNLGGVFSVHPGEIVQTPQTNSPDIEAVMLTGTLVGDVALDASSGSWIMQGGTIVGGTVNETQGAAILVGDGTFNAVTLNGPINVVAGSLTVLNGLVLNGTMQVGRIAGAIDYGYLTFGGPNAPAGSLTGNGTIVLGGQQVVSFKVNGNLTIGPDITLRGSGNLSSTLGILNNGTINSDAADVLGISGPLTNNGTLLASNGELHLDGAVTDNGTITIQSQGTLGGVPSLTINSGGRVTFDPSPSPNTATIAGLTINGSGVMDLGNTILSMSYPDQFHRPDAQLRSYLHSGYDGGKWDGPGIVSSLADATHGLALEDSLDGIPSLPQLHVVLQLARVGDVNLDGKVDFADLLILGQHFGQSGANWDQGDLNYDGSVAFADLLLLAQNYGSGAATPGAATDSSAATGLDELFARRRLSRRA